ncbi:MAG: hypothetical protein KZQ79_03055 [Candidatus Thiodiazotropha sp. (ex Lucinoma borealis)]|nr:hypothetical protein [Candidatus Thiodiazotropha sp. (ex Lucinoma borealis)]
MLDQQGGRVTLFLVGQYFGRKTRKDIVPIIDPLLLLLEFAFASILENAVVAATPSAGRNGVYGTA